MPSDPGSPVTGSRASARQCCPVPLPLGNVVALAVANGVAWFAVIVGLHVGAAVGFLAYFGCDWIVIVGAFATLGKRRPRL